MFVNPVDVAGFYAWCGCVKPATLQWDPHPDCVSHIPHVHYTGYLRDVDRNEIDCNFCKTIRGSGRQRWAALYRQRWGLADPFAPANEAASMVLPSYSHGAEASNIPPMLPSYSHGTAASISIPPEPEAIPPSGIVREDWINEILSLPGESVACYSAGAEPEDSLPEEVDDQGVEDDQPSSSQPNKDGDAMQRGSETFLASFRDLFARAVKSADIVTEPGNPQDPVVADFPRMAERVRDSTLPPYPHIERAFKRAEADPLLKSSSKFSQKGVDVLAVEVRNLNYKDWKIPQPERDVLSFNPNTKVGSRDTPKHPSQWGQQVDRYACDAWHASTRAAGLVSTAGMITAYMRKLCSLSNVEQSKAAIATAGIDGAEFGDVVASEAGCEYILEMERIADSLGSLLYSIALECGSSAAASTLSRRRLWLETAGVKEEFCKEWMAHSCAGNQGLFGTTPDIISKYKAAQAERETLHKELLPMMKNPPTPKPAVGTGQGDKPARKQKWRETYPKRGGKVGRGRGQGSRPNSQSSTDPAAKAAKPDSTDTSKKGAAK